MRCPCLVPLFCRVAMQPSVCAASSDLKEVYSRKDTTCVDVTSLVMEQCLLSKPTCSGSVAANSAGLHRHSSCAEAAIPCAGEQLHQQTVTSWCGPMLSMASAGWCTFTGLISRGPLQEVC